MLNLAVQLLAAASVVLASPVNLQSRAAINHDAVVGFPETVPSGIVGQLMLKYKPFLKVDNGCVPFPAVNAAGDTGAGLATSGDPSGMCKSSPGQVYARASTHKGAYAIMYSWYMPKDSPGPGLGHTHDWENIVVWLSAESATATIRGVAISAHGDYQKATKPNLSGTRPLIGYRSIFPINHQLVSTSTKGGEQPVIAWDSMPAAAKKAIENTDFGSAIPSFRDSNFGRYLDEAFI